MNDCAFVNRKSILDDLNKTIPDEAKVRFFDATEDLSKEMGFGDLAYLSTQPTAVLGIVGGTRSEREVKIITIVRPVRQIGEALAFVPYCLTEKRRSTIPTEKSHSAIERLTPKVQPIGTRMYGLFYPPPRRTGQCGARMSPLILDEQGSMRNAIIFQFTHDAVPLILCGVLIW